MPPPAVTCKSIAMRGQRQRHEESGGQVAAAALAKAVMPSEKVRGLTCAAYKSFARNAM